MFISQAVALPACNIWGHGGHGPMASAIARAKNELVWGQIPQQGPRAEPLVRRANPPEAETLLVFGRSIKAANCLLIYNLKTQRNQIFVLFLQKKIMALSKTGELAAVTPALA